MAGGSNRRCAAAIFRAARRAVSQLVGRDTDKWITPPAVGPRSKPQRKPDHGIQPALLVSLAPAVGVVLFKVVSTMDSMVGYKTARYLRFGWCGARLDDLMNLIPARLTFLLVSVTATLLPGYSGRKAVRVGLGQHSLLPGPNSGWSEAATAGALERRLVGPIWMHGHLVTDAWLGDPSDPPLETAGDYWRASALVALNGILAAVVAWVVLARDAYK